MQGRPLLVRQPEEGGLNLLEPDLAFLSGGSGRLGHDSSLLQAASLRHVATPAIDEGVVQDGKQPTP
jgi:hypothetical protein